jgi:hypothetical protein
MLSHVDQTLEALLRVTKLFLAERPAIDLEKAEHSFAFP